jgi:hypothetical protein
VQCTQPVGEAGLQRLEAVFRRVQQDVERFEAEGATALLAVVSRAI